MKIQKAIASLAAIAALTATVAMPSMASTTFASATTILHDFSYTGGPTGGLVVGQNHNFSSTALPASNDSGGDLSFTGLQNSGTAIDLNAGILWGQALTGGTFTLHHGATTYLTGTYTNAFMQGFTIANNPDASVSFFGVVYTGGSYFTQAQGLGYTNPGDLSLALLSDAPLAISGSYFQNFVASGTGTFGATPPVVHTGTPEPGTVVSFSIGALGLCALILRGRKTRGMSGLSA